MSRKFPGTVICDIPVSLNRTDADYAAFNEAEPIQAGPPHPNPTKSFWTDGEPGCNPLATEGSNSPIPESVDVCIIGSGLTGVSCAYHLARMVEDGTTVPMKVAIVEARDFCRNGGHLVAKRFDKMHGLTEKYGVEEARKSPAIEEHTVSEILRLVKENGWQSAVDLVECRRVDLVFSAEELIGIEKDIAAARNAKVAGFEDVEFLTAEQVQKEYKAKFPAYRQHGNNLWPLKLVTKLFQRAQGAKPRSGFIQSVLSAVFSNRQAPSIDLSLNTHTSVESVRPSSKGDRAYDVVTAKGIIQADYVVHATNAYVSHLLPQFTGPENGVVPTRGQVIATRAEISRGVLWNDNFVGNEGFEYWFPRPCPNSERPLIILGGGRESSPWETNVTDDSVLDETVGGTLRKFLPAVYPESFSKSSLPEFEWTGIMGYTKTRDPIVGLVSTSDNRPSGEYVSVGYSGHGMPRAFACAEVIAEMIVAKRTARAWERPSWLPIWYLTEQSHAIL
ncbi:hypothetical protein FRB90_001445 [Tulasnella sp. 427]|nr:hypothetical protein FRB90_001445 [Tulasnella sp. 427]